MARTHNHKVVVHHVAPINAIPISDELVLGWTIMHVIDDSSPLNSETDESLRRSGAQFTLSLSGTDETTGHTLMARQDYAGDAILWNKAFRDVLDVSDEGIVLFDYTQFHEVEDLPQAAASAKTLP